jgi:hypothetical protein
MDRRMVLVAAASVLASAGCATPGGLDGGQRIAVATATAAGEPVADLDCVLRNDKGEWHVRTPGSVAVRLSSMPLELACGGAGWRMAPGAAARVEAVTGAPSGAALGGGVGGAAAAVGIGAAGGTAVAAAAAGPLVLIGVTIGAGLGWLAGRVGTAHHYPAAVVVTVELRPADAR